MRLSQIYWNFHLAILVLVPPSLWGIHLGDKQWEDIYIVIYATQEGFTGHAGIAVDNYDIFVIDEWVDGQLKVKYDTVANGTLTYFDMFGPQDIRWEQFKDNLQAHYNKLPKSSAEEKITPTYLVTRGLPHKYNTPCDALLRITTNALADFELIDKIELITRKNKYFNPSFFNCTDFVLECLKAHDGRSLDARENMIFAKASTPNQLYHELIKQDNIKVIKKPGESIDASFFKEIIFKKYLHNLNPF